jgi:hypothetical protein
MNRRYILPLSALVGVAIAVAVIVQDNRPVAARIGHCVTVESAAT